MKKFLFMLSLLFVFGGKSYSAEKITCEYEKQIENINKPVKHKNFYKYSEKLTELWKGALESEVADVCGIPEAVLKTKIGVLWCYDHLCFWIIKGKVVRYYRLFDSFFYCEDCKTWKSIWFRSIYFKKYQYARCTDCDAKDVKKDRDKMKK